MLKKILCLLFVLVLSFSFYVPVFADEENGDDEKTVDIVDRFYVTTTGVESTITVPFNVNWFKADARDYSHDLAKLSLGLATSAFRPHKKDEFLNRPNDYNLNFFLYQCGFNDLRSDDYDKDPNRYTVSTVMGHRTVGEGDDAFELIAVGICGQGYLDEWESNFSIGTGDNPDGFVRSAQLVYDRIFGYIAANHISGPIKIWLSGFSRAAAISNIAAARLSDSGVFSQSTVFAYTFATPMTTREEEPGIYENIFNICGKMDPVVNVPFPDWGYTRYGKTFFTPVIETDSDYLAKREKADVIYKDITGISYWINSDMNIQLRIIMDSLLRICPDVETYSASLQDKLIALWEKHDPRSVLYRLLEMANDPLLVNEENRQDANMFLNHVAGLALSYVGSTNSFRRFNDKASLGSNVMQAHTPELYLSWLFSVDNGEDLFSDTATYTQIYIEGDVTVSLYREGELLESLETGDVDRVKELLYLSFSDHRISVVIPRDRNYAIKIVSNDDQTINALSADFEVGHQAPLKSNTRYFKLVKGESLAVNYPQSGSTVYSLASDYTKSDRFDLGNGSDRRFDEFLFNEDSTLTWRDVVLFLIIASIMGVSAVLFVLAVLVIYLRFRHGRKKGYIPGKIHFRPLPILCSFLVLQLFLIKEFFTGLYNADPSAINQFKLIMGFLILVIAFYGYRRKKDLFHILIMAATVILTAADVAMTTSLPVGALIYVAAYILLCYNYLKRETLEKAQIITMAVLSLAEIWYVMRIDGSFGVLRVLAIVYLLSATALVVTSFTHSGRIFRGSALLFISGILLIYNSVRGTTFVSHIIASGLHYIAVITLASSGSGFSRPKAMPVNASDSIIEQG